MNGMLSKDILETLRQADFERIVHYIIEICGLLVGEFQQNNRRLPNDENQIRSIMVEEYLEDDEIRKVHNMSGYSFIPESQENYTGNGNYLGRTDIRIKLKSDFEKKNAYYIVECKRLDGSGDLNKKYVDEGIARFITQKYSSYYGRNIMLGFVVKKIDISDNVKAIEASQNSNDNVCLHGNMEFVEKEAICENYKCSYQMEAGKLELQHIFTDYSDVIE